jgi:DNA-directed RNA polymerase subunit RPC12/RpoP
MTFKCVGCKTLFHDPEAQEAGLRPWHCPSCSQRHAAEKVRVTHEPVTDPCFGCGDVAEIEDVDEGLVYCEACANAYGLLNGPYRRL